MIWLHVHPDHDLSSSVFFLFLLITFTGVDVSCCLYKNVSRIESVKICLLEVCAVLFLVV